jgi:hypothetical protein
MYLFSFYLIIIYLKQITIKCDFYTHNLKINYIHLLPQSLYLTFYSQYFTHATNIQEKSRAKLLYLIFMK